MITPRLVIAALSAGFDHCRENPAKECFTSECRNLNGYFSSVEASWPWIGMISVICVPKQVAVIFKVQGFHNVYQYVLSHRSALCVTDEMHFALPEHGIVSFDLEARCTPTEDIARVARLSSVTAWC